MMIGLVLAAAAAATAAATAGVASKCEPILIEMCQDLPYNMTSFPNLVRNEDQREAGIQLQTFTPLVQVQCSAQLKFFLCSVYVPMCDKVPMPIGPCRPLCEAVKQRCEPMLSQFGFPWPASLNCSKYPAENNDRSMCMKGPNVADDEPPATRRPTTPRSQRPSAATACATQLRDAGRFVYVNRSGVCTVECDSDARFGAAQKETAATTIFVLATVCCIISVICFVLLVCKCNQLTVRYPEMALLCLTFCECVFSAALLVSTSRRQDTVCMNYAGRSILVVAGMQHVPCTLGAILIYYFGSAARLWWLMLCWLWLLHSAIGLDADALYKRRFPMQVFAWGAPLVAVVAVLMAQAVDADELSNVCFVGQRQPHNLLVFVGVRELLVGILGAVPLLLALLTMCDANANKVQPPVRNHLFGLLCVAYLPVSATLSICYLSDYAALRRHGLAAAANAETTLVKLVAELLFGIVSATAALLWTLLSLIRANSAAQTTKTYVSVPLAPPNSAATDLTPSRPLTASNYTKPEYQQWKFDI